MSTNSLTGKDTFTLYTPDHRVFTDFADENILDLKFPNEIATVKTGKDGNTIYGLNETGRQADLTMRLVRGSSDDKYMQALLNLQLANFSGFIFLSGQFIKKTGDGTGAIGSDIYNVTGGVFVKPVEAMSNVTGSSDQSVSVYSLRFGGAIRVIS